MKIAQVAPLYESVPPRLYGGTERVISYLTEELVAQGHDVTLFATGDSMTNARLIPACDRALRLEGNRIVDPLACHFRMLETVARQSQDFDLIHFHVDYLHFPLSRRLPIRAITTLHGRLDIPELWPLYREYRDMHLVSISNSQRKPVPWANWEATVYHGLPEGLFQARSEPGKYLAFLGRISPEKGIENTIEIALRAGIPVKIAAKIDAADQKYFETKVRKLFDHPMVEFIGEINERQKSDFLGNALALLFPIDWPEPFGLVMIEAMACGTPVIAYPGGSVTEIIEEGISGFLVDNVSEAVEAVHRIYELDRLACRRVFEERFSARRMCLQYLGVYQRLCEQKPGEPSLVKRSEVSPSDIEPEIRAN